VTIRRNDNTEVVPWKSLATSNELYGELKGLTLTSYSTYKLLLRVNNNANLTSRVISNNFTIETEAPIIVSSEFVIGTTNILYVCSNRDKSMSLHV